MKPASPSSGLAPNAAARLPASTCQGLAKLCRTCVFSFIAVDPATSDAAAQRAFCFVWGAALQSQTMPHFLPPQDLCTCHSSGPKYPRWPSSPGSLLHVLLITSLPGEVLLPISGSEISPSFVLVAIYLCVVAFWPVCSFPLSFCPCEDWSTPPDCEVPEGRHCVCSDRTSSLHFTGVGAQQRLPG